MHYEAEIKARVIDFLFSKMPGISSMASEIRFADNLRRADLLIVDNDGCHVVEVKGPRDSATKLHEQLRDTQEHFKYAWLACDSTVYHQAIRRISPSVGILLVDEQLTVSQKRKARARKITKDRLLVLATKSELTLVARKLGLGSLSSASLAVLRRRVKEKLNRNELEALITEIINNRYKERFEYFLAHKSPSTNADDIYFLEISPTDELSS